MFKEGWTLTKHDPSSSEAWMDTTCPYCNAQGTVFVVRTLYISNTKDSINWLLCSRCGKGFVWNNGIFQPAAPFGPEIEGLPDEIKDIYTEARNCFVVNAFNASELICRKILMHVAVEKKAKKGLKFIEYIDFLIETDYITSEMKDWVQLIRKHGNKATHEIEKANEKRAKSTLLFTAEFLRIVYEMKHKAVEFLQTNNETNE